jgi:hypothetical protein
MHLTIGGIKTNKEKPMSFLHASLALATTTIVVPPLLNVVLTLVVVGILLWLINRFIPMQGTIKSILNAVVVIVVVLWLLQAFGLLSGLTGTHVIH